ncbi:MAG: polysaccharide pyruvyl transferase family protein [Patescibacteria group bacterium]|jgi:pyruvyltransferase
MQLPLPVKTSWVPKRNNWGDVLAPLLIETLSGQPPVFSREANGRCLTVGSLITPDGLRTGDHIWGSGMLKRADISQTLELTFHAVRGPISRELLRDQGWEVPEVYGDPALLMPFILKAAPTKHTQRTIGIVPHLTVPTESVAALSHVRADIRVIDVTVGVENFIRELVQCDVVLSSSLHGIIAAEAYGIPAAWVELHQPLEGLDDVDNHLKYSDCYASTNRECPAPISWMDRFVDAAMVEDAAAQAESTPRPTLDLESLLRACPFNVRGVWRPEELPGRQIELIQ